MIIKVNTDDLEKVRKILEENGYEVLEHYDDEIVDRQKCCPKCGDSEFFDIYENKCNHCGWEG